MVNDRILLVDDSAVIHLVIESLINKKWPLKTVSNLTEAKKELETSSYALLLLDLQLPDGCGFEFCEKLRQADRYNNLSIIFLTGSKFSIADKIKNFTIGADDYVLKPIEPKELLVRVETKFKNHAIPATPITFSKSKFRTDLVLQQAFVKNDSNAEVRLDLKPIEFKLFSYFLLNAGRIFTRDELRQAVWGEDVFVTRHTIDTHVSSLRKKMGAYGSYLKAVIKQGYCFVLPEQNN